MRRILTDICKMNYRKMMSCQVFASVRNRKKSVDLSENNELNGKTRTLLHYLRAGDKKGEKSKKKLPSCGIV